MPSIEIRPVGGVEPAPPEVADPTWIPPEFIVGDGAQWGDGSDGTYARLTQIVGSAETPHGAALLPTVNIPGTITSFDFHVRCAAVPTAYASSVSPFIAYYTDTEMVGLVGSAGIVVTSTSPEWIVGVGLGGAAELSDLATRLAAGTARVVAPAPANAFGTNSIDIYETWIVVHYEPRRRVQPPLRLTQRGDGLTGGAPRLIGNRTRQASLRIGPGSIL